MHYRILAVISTIVILAASFYFFDGYRTLLTEYKKQQELHAVLNKKIGLMTSSLDYENKVSLSKMPCSQENKDECKDKDEILKEIQSYLADKNLQFTAVVDAEGQLISSGLKVEKTFINLIKLINDTSIKKIDNQQQHRSVFLKAPFGNQEKEIITTISDISSVTGEDIYKGYYLLSFADSSLLEVSYFHEYTLFASLVVLPFILALLFQERLVSKLHKINSRLSEENINVKMQAENFKSENMRQSQFLANFTHELRTPLNSIIGFSGLIKDETLGPIDNDEYIKYASDINGSGLHLLSMLNDILDYSKAEVGKLRINSGEADIIKAIKQCLAIIAPRAAESGVDLHESYASKHFLVNIDTKRFKQVLLNLLSNAVKFTDTGGTVTVSVFPNVQRDRLIVEVRDTGVGIAEKDIATAMSLFGQVETDLNRNYEGTGIGLPFSKKLCSAMDISMELSSKVGVGTKITLGIPFDKNANSEFYSSEDANPKASMRKMDDLLQESKIPASKARNEKEDLEHSYELIEPKIVAEAGSDSPIEGEDVENFEVESKELQSPLPEPEFYKDEVIDTNSSFDELYKEPSFEDSQSRHKTQLIEPEAITNPNIDNVANDRQGKENNLEQNIEQIQDLEQNKGVQEKSASTKQIKKTLDDYLREDFEQNGNEEEYKSELILNKRED